MPELPEVETTRRGISPYITKATITTVIIRHFSLRWPIAPDLAHTLTGQCIHNITRRAKYLLFHCDSGTLIMHLGMSGKLRVLTENTLPEPKKHDHFELQFNNGQLLRYNDPRRFGAILWTSSPSDQHKLLAHLGPEPLSKDFATDYFYQHSQARKCSIKTLIMNGTIVVGVGNIYANEALFLAKIHPNRSTHTLDKQQCASLVSAIKIILNNAIKAGGTTLKDFTQSDGKPGYFTTELAVYGRDGKTCTQCPHTIKRAKQGQRATFYCPHCQI